MRALISPSVFRPALRAVLVSAALSSLALAGTAAAQTPAMGTAKPSPPLESPDMAMAASAHPFHETRAERRRESIDQRIASLHGALRITPDEEADWKAVAQVMRWNEASMEKLVLDRREDRKAHAPDSLSALEEMKAYEAFNRAHLDGLKDLIASFTTLYNAMPEPQKIRADHVFQSFGHEGLKSHG